MEPRLANGTGQGSAMDRLAYARELWRADESIPMNGDNGMIARLQEHFRGASASIQALLSVRSEVRKEKAGGVVPSLAERARKAEAEGVLMPKNEKPHGSRGREDVKWRAKRFYEIAREHPDWPEGKLVEQLKEETGSGIGAVARTKLMRKARGVTGPVTGRVTWKRARERQLKRQARKTWTPPDPDFKPKVAPPPARRGRLSADEQQTLAAIQRLVATVPGIHTVTVHEDGSAEYTLREVIERRGRLKL